MRGMVLRCTHSLKKRAKRRGGGSATFQSLCRENTAMWRVCSGGAIVRKHTCSERLLHGMSYHVASKDVRLTTLLLHLLPLPSFWLALVLSLLAAPFPVSPPLWISCALASRSPTVTLQEPAPRPNTRTYRSKDATKCQTFFEAVLKCLPLFYYFYGALLLSQYCL